MSDVRRVELGFAGGGVLRLTMEEGAAQELAGSLSGGPVGWRAVESEQGTHWVNLSELLYLRLVPGDAHLRVGFGQGS